MTCTGNADRLSVVTVSKVRAALPLGGWGEAGGTLLVVSRLDSRVT